MPNIKIYGLGSMRISEIKRALKEALTPVQQAATVIVPMASLDPLCLANSKLRPFAEITGGVELSDASPWVRVLLDFELSVDIIPVAKHYPIS